jgi:Signal transduction histidine kinase
MRKERLSTILFVVALCAVVCILGYGGRALYEIQRQAERTQVIALVQETARTMQEENVTTLNNLAGALEDEDMDEKTAFAAGITGNTGKMRIWFDDNQQASQQQEKKQEQTTGKQVLKIDKAFIQQNGIKYQPESDKGIQHFDSMFRRRLGEQQLSINYNIHKQTPKDTTYTDSNYQYSSPLFIVSFFKPQVYRIDFSIYPASFFNKLYAYIAVCCVLVGLLVAAYVFMRRSYRLQAQMARLRESLFSNIAHELKTPLSSLQLVVDSAAAGQPLSAQHKGYAQAELNRMNLMVEKILAFGKMDKDQFELNKEVVDMDEVVRNAIQAMEPAIQRHGAAVKYSGGAHTRITGDKVLLTNTITTLIDNALKYNRNIPEIIIGIQPAGSGMQLHVADNGIGIAQEYHKHIFKPFFRIPTGNLHEVKGHGLGLSLAAQVAALHRGSIGVASNANGSTFTIYLPTS